MEDRVREHLGRLCQCTPLLRTHQTPISVAPMNQTNAPPLKRRLGLWTRWMLAGFAGASAVTDALALQAPPPQTAGPDVELTITHRLAVIRTLVAELDEEREQSDSPPSSTQWLDAPTWSNYWANVNPWSNFINWGNAWANGPYFDPDAPDDPDPPLDNPGTR